MADDALHTPTAADHTVRPDSVWTAVSAALAERAEVTRRPLQVIDLGGGAGGLAVRIARLGHRVTVVDPSPNALASLTRWVAEAGVANLVEALQGDTDSLADLVEAASADAVLCHGVLEHVDDPRAAVRSIAAALAPGGVFSLLVAQRLGTVVSRALAGRFEQARTALLAEDGRWGEKDPLRRRFDAAAVAELLTDTGLDVVDAEGVRLFGDHVPAGLLESENDHEALAELERAITGHPASAHLAHIGSSLHVLARKVEGTSEGP